jgi:hypothetical protein
MSAWQATFAPKGTPKTIIGKLNAAVVDALADPVVRSRLADIGQEIPPRDQQTPEALAAYQKAEMRSGGRSEYASTSHSAAHARRALPCGSSRSPQAEYCEGEPRTRRQSQFRAQNGSVPKVLQKLRS